MRSTDRGINSMQQDVRRSLMLHSAVAPADIPHVLSYMSIVKDAERIGDYAKNMYDLAKYGEDFPQAADAAGTGRVPRRGWQAHRRRRACVRHRVTKTRLDASSRRPTDSSTSTTTRSGPPTSRPDPPVTAVARALYFRYLKRITAHLMNMLTSLVLPIDLLDYYDEAPEDR